MSDTFDLMTDVIYVDKCPICGAPVKLAGRTPRLPGANESSILMGYPGFRWIICHEGDWIHFKRTDVLYGGNEIATWEGLAYVSQNPNSDLPGLYDDISRESEESTKKHSIIN